MTKFLATVFVLQTTLSFGQTTQKNPYEDLKSIIIPDSLPLSEVKYFVWNDGLTVESYTLDSSGVYTMLYDACSLYRSRDTGTWKISKNTLSLSSSKHKISLDVAILGEYYFFIRFDDRERFIRRVKETEAAYTQAQSIEMTKDMNAMAFLTGETLHREFYVADYKRNKLVP